MVVINTTLIYNPDKPEDNIYNSEPHTKNEKGIGQKVAVEFKHESLAILRLGGLRISCFLSKYSTEKILKTGFIIQIQ